MRTLHFILLKFVFLFIILLGVCSCSDNVNPVTPPLGFATLRILTADILSAPPDYAFKPGITVSPVSGEIFCCWNRVIGDAPEIFWRHGEPGNFTEEEVITDADGIRSWKPSICAGPDDRVHFSWMDRKIDGVQKEIYAGTWTNGIWGPEEHLSLYDGWTGWNPIVDVYPDGRPVVCWYDHRYGVQHELLLRIGDGNGMWWPDVRLTDDNHWQYFPDIAIGNDSVVHISYVDTREILDEWEDPDHNVEGKNLEIYYRNWDGLTLGNEVRVTNTPLRSAYSQIEVDNAGNPHMIWLDESARGYFQLYYTRIESGRPGGIIPVSNVNRRAELSTVDCLGDRVFIAYSEYIDPYGSACGPSNIYIREVLHDGRIGNPLPVATGGTNIRPRIAKDLSRNMLWILWVDYVGDDETLETGESFLRLCGIEVR